MDLVMYYGTKSILWLPLFLLFFYFTIRQFKWKALIILCLAAVMILVSDQLANLFKEFFQRLRPSHEQGLQVHLVNAYKGGIYGFYSSHASNSFSVAVFLTLLLGKRFRWIVPLLFSWALFFTYTRLYLGVHFPGDLLMGMLMGSLLGYGFGKLFLTIQRRSSS